jgi:hypothetical protein
MLNATGIVDVERHSCLHIETNIECLLRLSQTHREASSTWPLKSTTHGPQSTEKHSLSTETDPCFFSLSPSLSLSHTHTHTDRVQPNQVQSLQSFKPCFCIDSLLSYSLALQQIATLHYTDSLLLMHNWLAQRQCAWFVFGRDSVRFSTRVPNLVIEAAHSFSSVFPNICKDSTLKYDWFMVDFTWRWFNCICYQMLY